MKMTSDVNLEREFASCIDGVEHEGFVASEQDIDRLLDVKLIEGRHQPFTGPFGAKLMVYADWTASGRAYEPIEEYVRQTVVPFYANTHTTSSISGLQTMCFRREAREIVQNSTNANPCTDAVLFTGNGATGAVNKMIGILGLNTAPVRSNQGEVGLMPVVFVGPFEHHSNLLPWRESFSDVVNIKENESGTGLDKNDLQNALETYKDRPLLIGAFSAASNLTGIIEDVDGVSALLHRYGALAMWDYAAAAPYVSIDMNPVLPDTHPDSGLVYKDAVFVSPHKFLGGIGTPGLLIAKKRLFTNPVPAGSSIGGGTVFFVKEDSHRFLSNRIDREEGGTPNIIGSVRLGLTFSLKQRIGCSFIASRDQALIDQFRAGVSGHPHIVMLGSDQPSEWGRLPIFSLLIRYPHEAGKYLHYNFVCSLLNDLYGIQTRGGCMCAGVYSQRILGIKREVIDSLESELMKDTKNCEYLRVGFSRISLHYTMTDEEVRFIIKAVCDIAEHGWKLLPLYRFNPRTGECKHRKNYTKFADRLWLSDAFSFDVGLPKAKESTNGWDPISILNEARRIMLDTSEALKENLVESENMVSEAQASLVWFAFPSDALKRLRGIGEGILQTGMEKNHIIEPHVYLSGLNTQDNAPQAGSSNTVNEKLVVTKKRVEPVKASTCTNGFCFLPRQADKYPRRSGKVEEINANGSHDLGLQSEASLTLVNSKAMAQKPKTKPGRKSFIRILRQVGKAIAEWNMIQDGDRLLLGLSGGKDSLCLLHVLLDLQKRAPVKFSLGACTIDPLTESYDPSTLIPYVEGLGVPYFYVKDPIFEKASSGALQGTSICSFCSRMKRGALYSTARKNNYNKLVLAQHLDDFAESALMNMFHNGHLRSMLANYEECQGDVTVIRPLAYVREMDTKEFAYGAKLPIVVENCPACFEAPQERKRMKRLLAKEEATCPGLFGNLRRALIPLMDKETLDSHKSLVDGKEAKSKRRTNKRSVSDCA